MKQRISYEPTECEECSTTEEGCTDNYRPGHGWVCGDCADTIDWEEENE